MHKLGLDDGAVLQLMAGSTYSGFNKLMDDLRVEPGREAIARWTCGVLAFETYIRHASRLNDSSVRWLRMLGCWLGLSHRTPR